MPDSKPAPAKVPKDILKAEVKNALNEEYKDSGKKVTDSAIDAVFQFFDYNNDKKLSVGEFIDFDMVLDAVAFNYQSAIVI
ncbi:hypothetical protein POX_b02217 [Penicillium oxalicum]|uniref:hypothetical protein n=1 Tax=Penicillium oxalicum TaxID=69781 RepID=UPI0020B6BBE1|nr:hypothetical protein POX_b02217 [Penicillium oxalicum]KAI2792180.1 hypothetical protein POX_b02217 [Penicillium oxalicum]